MLKRLASQRLLKTESGLGRIEKKTQVVYNLQ